ncbi:mating-type protein [Tricholoma matsutake]|nr:mating-type protein [Tricholoma matsutake 945]
MPMEPSIRERLSCVEDDLLQAATRGLPALNVFCEAWSTLLSDTDHAIRSKTIKDETRTLGGVVASRIAILSDYLLEFQNSADEMEMKLESLFARIDINGTSDDHLAICDSGSPSKGLSHHPSNFSVSFPQRASSASLDRNACPPYIEPAYRWLLGHLHNPYPPREIREAMSLQTSSHRRVIDAWFVNARKRMGWNSLRRAHFSNKRVDIVDAATRFFVQEDPKRPLDPNVELEFAAIETRAKDLYSDKFSESTLAAKLDLAVKDMTPEMKAQAREDERRRRQAEKEKQVESSTRDVLATSYSPSPVCSSDCTAEPFLSSPSPSLSEDDVQSLADPRTSSKRRRPSPDSNDFGAVDQSNKPHRSDAPSSSAAITTIGLLSPASSSSDSHGYSPSAPSNPLPIPCISNRKRRLSDAALETCHAPKRPCNLPVWPRPHSASDPLPLSAIDDWFHNNFGIPNAVTVEAPDESVPVEVDIFDYSTLNGGALYEVFDSPTGSVERSVDHTVPPAVEPPTSNQIPSYALEISTNDFNYDELFCDPEVATPDLRGGNLPLPPSLPMPSSTNFALNPFDLNSFPSIVFPDPADDTAAIADLSAPVFQNPASNLQWNFPSIISPQHLLGPMDEFQNPGLNFFTQDDSFMFDPSMMSIYSSCLPGESVLPLPITADKAEKQRKLLEMKEATRLLEAEIAAS